MTQHKNFSRGKHRNPPEKNERTLPQPTGSAHPQDRYPQGQQQGQQHSRSQGGGQQGGFNAAHDGRLPQATYGTQPGFDISDFDSASEPANEGQGRKK